MKAAKTEKLNKCLFIMGFAAVLIMVIPYMILGQNSIVVYHDQLDGEVIAYMLQAKHLFEGKFLPEFMGGVYGTVLTPPAPAATLLFKFLSAFAALVTLQLLGSVIGYLGMYGLVKYVTGNSLIAMVVGIMYGYLPFLPVYGLSQYGIPMLIFLLLYAMEKKTGKAVFSSLLYGIFYSLNSSLVLVGFGILGSIIVWMILLLIRREKKACGCMALVWSGMLVTYVLENMTLILQTLGLSDTYVSHKTEYTLFPEAYAGGFLGAFINGGQHSEDFHKYFLWLILLEAVCCLLPFVYKRIEPAKADMKNKYRKIHRIMCICILVNACYAFIAALWNGSIGVTLRVKFGALGAFQMDRLLWIAPCLWYLAFACGLALLAGIIIQRRSINISGKSSAAFIVLRPLILPAAVLITVIGGKILLESNLKPNLQKVINPEYGAISFNDYYAVGVMDEVDALIMELTGKTQDEYRVVSLGIDPAAALYHGFYCLDGYSNNYPLEYKHEFRSIIASELDKNGYLTEYFDGWGNRCYLFSAECPGYYTIEKGGFYFQNYSIDIEALKSMGGEYIISAAYIANAEELGLVLLNEEPFETADSYYRIYVYGLQ